MTDCSDEEARWKIAELAKTLALIESQLPILRTMIGGIGSGSAPIQGQWRTMHAMTSTLNIVIQKPTERPESLDDLPGMEILKRTEFRSCHDALCAKPHCTEDGKCGHKKHDGHRCKCPVCGLEYISSASGDEHNLDGECKESSGE